MEIARNCLGSFPFSPPNKMKDKPSHLEFIKLQVGTPEGIKIWWGQSLKITISLGKPFGFDE